MRLRPTLVAIALSICLVPAAFAVVGREGQDDAARLSDEAFRLGSRDPLLLYHAGVIASAAGDVATARERLTTALALDPGFSPTGSAAARVALAEIAAAR